MECKEQIKRSILYSKERMAHLSRCEQGENEFNVAAVDAGCASGDSVVGLKAPDNIHYNVEGQNTSMRDSFNDPDWRRPRKDAPPNKSFRARFSYNPSRGFGSSGFGDNRNTNVNNTMKYPHKRNGRPYNNGFDWQTAKVAANHLKFCAGDNCKEWLPLHAFGSNYNMPDNLDNYCISCNNSHRIDRRAKRNRHPFPKKAKRDKFCVFKEDFEKEVLRETQMREVEKRMRLACAEAKGRYKREIPLDTAATCRRLFTDDMYLCEVTGDKMTPDCFLDHHSITLELRHNGTGGKVVDVICSDCKKV